MAGAEQGAARKVLEAAEAVFAERGFAGARVDEIAARAGMAKSHVYYHFEGKEQMLERLVAWRLEELLAAKDALLSGVEAFTPEALASFIPRAVEELLVPRATFVRVVLLESLGSAASEPLLLKVLRPLLEDALQRFQARGYQVGRDQFLSDFFHFGLVPLAVHLALGDRWAAAAGLEPGRARGLLVKRLVELQALNVGQLPRRKAGAARKRGRS